MHRSPVSPVSPKRDNKVLPAMKPFQFPRAPQAQPAQRTAHNAPAQHARSHSRNGSTTTSAQIPKSASDPTNLSSAGKPRSRPSSHHRRNSSISTRRESAELMGVSIPAAPADSDSIADPVLKALLALEGKQLAQSPRDSFVARPSTVHIPSDLDAAAAVKLHQSDARKPLALNSSLAGKRDSFGKLLTPASATSEGKLGTLMEVDEEEEENIKPQSPVVTPSKARPQNLTLHPLALTPTLAAKSLPTPSPTPSPRLNGLRTLTLSATSTTPRAPSPSASAARRTVNPAPIQSTDDSSPPKPKGIPYKREESAKPPRTPKPKPLIRVVPEGIITPEPTPTTTGPPDLSPSRKAFIYQSHAALVTRVAELEQQLSTLSARPSPAPSPARRASPLPSPTFSQAASDEFLSLIADLKAERDSLRRDVKGWQTRVGDLEKQAGVLTARVETERRAAWVAKEQLGVLEAAKAGVEREATALAAQVASLQQDVARARAETEAAQRALAVSQAQAIKSARTPGFQSMDSLGSTTDVDSRRSSMLVPARKLKAVEEEDNGADELAHYEDEDEDSDQSFYTPSRRNSSFSLPAQPALGQGAHNRKGSMAGAWTFPRGPVRAAPRAPAEVDRFFVCLDEDDASDPESEDDGENENATLTRPKLGFGFGHGFGFGTPDDDEDDMPPFVLPAPKPEPAPAPARLGAGLGTSFRFPPPPPQQQQQQPFQFPRRR